MTQISADETANGGGERAVPPQAKPKLRTGGLIGAILTPLAALAATVGRLFTSRGGGANVLGHEPANALGHQATNALGHQPTNALGHQATGSLGAEGAAAPTPSAPPSQGPSPQTVAAGAAVAAAVAAAILAALLLSGDPEPEQAEPPAPTTTVPPVELPVSGPGEFTVAGVDLVTGNVFADAGLGSDPELLVITAIQGSTDNVGVPFALPSGATVTLGADGSLQYDPGEAFRALGGGESTVDEIGYTVSTGPDFLAEWTVTISIEGVNDPPVLSGVAAVSVVAGTVKSVDLTAIDPDSDAVAFTLEQPAPPFVSLADAGDGVTTLSIAPGPGHSGVHEVTITATDDGSPPQPVSATFTIAVSPEPLTRVGADLLILYEFDEADGSTVSDTSGFGEPHDLTIVDPMAVRWEEGSLTIDSPALLIGAAPATKLLESVSVSNGVTMEAWVTPTDSTQFGPARVMSLSSGIGLRNMTLGQGDTAGPSGDHWTGRLRSTLTSENGLPSLATPAGTAGSERRTHVVFTRSAAGRLTIYVDGVVQATATGDGDLSNWDPSFHLMLANETSLDRPWLGAFHLVALYGRALTAAEVNQNLQVGP